MWLTLFVRFSHRRFHQLLHWATSLQIRPRPETSCRHWESKFLARVLKSRKSMNMQEGRQQKDLDSIKPQTGKKRGKHASSPLKKNSAVLCLKKMVDIMFFKCLLECPHVNSPSDTVLMGLFLKKQQQQQQHCRFLIGLKRIRQTVPNNILAPTLCSPKHAAHPYFTMFDREPRQRRRLIWRVWPQKPPSQVNPAGTCTAGPANCLIARRKYIYKSVFPGATVHLEDGVVLAVASSFGLCIIRSKRDESPGGSGPADESWGRTAGWGLWADDRNSDMKLFVFCYEHKYYFEEVFWT